MTDLLFQMGLSNACFALALAIVAMVVGATTKRPHLAHMLWLLVFVKLVTPPIVAIRVPAIPEQPAAAVAINNHSRSGAPVANNSEPDVAKRPDASLSARIGSAVFTHGKEWLPPIWLLGSVVVLAWSLVRVYRFGRLLAAESEVAPQPLQAAAVKIARRLKLSTIPTICTTSARISPMVWWAGGKVRIVIPATLLDQMDEEQWQWILAHELAHVRRRDYLVRWLEWLSCVCFWWNPVVWWARRNLRRAEEICCDALVLSCLKPKPRSYANSLLTAVEFLACPVLRPPAMASEINSGGFLERRFGMIVSETPNRVNSRWLQACVLLCAMVVLPFGLASAQDYDAVAKRLGHAVEHRELTEPQADAMLATLKKMAKKAGEKDELNAYFKQVWAKLQALVKEGKMSAEDAEAKMIAIKKAKLGAGKKDAYYKAIGEKIEPAVKAGKMTDAEARAKWFAIKKAPDPKIKKTPDPKIKKAPDPKIKKTPDPKKDQGSDRVKAYLMKVKKELGAAVETGRISREDAAKRFEGAEKAIRERMAAGRSQTRAKKDQDLDRAKAYLMKVKKEFGAAIEAGKISREDAVKRYEGAEKAIKERMTAGRGRGDSKRITREEYAQAEAKLRKAVAEGKISGEDGRAKLATMRKMMGEQSKGAAKKITREDLARVAVEIRKNVAEGKISEEDGRAKLAAMRKMMGEQSKGAAKKITREDYARAAVEIRKAIAEGKISEENGRAKMAAMRKKMGEQSEAATRKIDWEGIKRRIEGAVKSGDLTREEADAKYREIRNGMAERRQRRSVDESR